MQICAAGYAVTYVTTLKLQLVIWTVVGLTAANEAPFPARPRYVASARTA
jgi:hypothetical protein